MKEAKGVRILFAWLYRLALPVYLYLVFKNDLADGIVFTDANDLIMLLSLLFAVLLIIGDFFKKDTLTKISGLILIIIAVIAVLKGMSLILWFFPFFVALYFLIYGNQA